jgi:hypothetical protein
MAAAAATSFGRANIAILIPASIAASPPQLEELPSVSEPEGKSFREAYISDRWPENEFRR